MSRNVFFEHGNEYSHLWRKDLGDGVRFRVLALACDERVMCGQDFVSNSVEFRKYCRLCSGSLVAAVSSAWHILEQMRRFHNTWHVPSCRGGSLFFFLVWKPVPCLSHVAVALIRKYEALRLLETISP